MMLIDYRPPPAQAQAQPAQAQAQAQPPAAATALPAPLRLAVTAGSGLVLLVMPPVNSVTLPNHAGREALHAVDHRGSEIRAGQVGMTQLSASARQDGYLELALGAAIGCR